MDSYRSSIIWLEHQKLADLYRTNEWHQVLSTLVSSNIHSRAIECCNGETHLKFTADMQAIIDTHYRDFSRAIYDWKCVLGVVPWVPVILLNRVIVPFALDFDVCQVGIYYDAESSSSVFLVRFHQDFTNYLLDRNMTLPFELSDWKLFGNETGSYNARDARTMIARRVDYGCFTNGLDTVDHGVMVMDGFGCNPTPKGVITSLVACSKPILDEYHFFENIRKSHYLRVSEFRPFCEMAPTSDQKHIEEYLQSLQKAGSGGQELAEAFLHRLTSLTSSAHQHDRRAESTLNAHTHISAHGPTGIAAMATPAPENSRSTRLINQVIMQMMNDSIGQYSAVLGGQISSWHPPTLSFDFMTTLYDELRTTMCNLYGVPSSNLRPLSSQQGNVEMLADSFQRRINTENSYLERALNYAFGVIQLRSTASSYVALKFASITRPKALRRIREEKRRPFVWSFVAHNSEYKQSGQDIAYRLQELKAANPGVEFALRHDRSTKRGFTWEPIGDTQSIGLDDPNQNHRRPRMAHHTFHMGTPRRPSRLRISGLDEYAIGTKRVRFSTAERDSKTESTTPIPTPGELADATNMPLHAILGNIDGLTPGETDDIYMFLTESLTHEDLVSVYDQFLDEESATWMERQLSKVSDNSWHDARNIRLTYRNYGSNSISEMVSIFLLGLIPQQELIRQVRHRMNLENKPNNEWPNAKFLADMRELMQHDIYRGALHESGLAEVSALLNTGRKARVDEMREQEELSNGPSSKSTGGTKRKADEFHDTRTSKRAKSKATAD